MMEVDKLESKGNNDECPRFDQWVDYLPHHHTTKDEEDSSKSGSGGLDFVKRASLDVTESHLTESQDDSNRMMDTENWPDSASLEDYAMVPNALLVENDPVLQHELLLNDPTIINVVSEQFTSSLQEVLEDRRRVLMASMEASQRTRRCLEPHIKQRASLASVLSDIEGSSKSLREHVLLHPPSLNHHHSITPIDEEVHMEDEEEQEMLASALDLEDEPPPPSPADVPTD